jgi:hypothetical protein
VRDCLKFAGIAGLLVVAGLGCGSDFHREDLVVASVTDAEVCVDDPGYPAAPEECVKASAVEGAAVEVGDCVRTHHAGESARLLDLERIDCDPPSPPATAP